ncbi:protein of unknown function [Chryseobacterium taichungense]|uniref:DUF4180 domain-containing protein n=2 Tax=Chryseobacterium taichungense TaxID=295069 RepID=A0A1H8C3D2_9FLAO|nr:protein of unknown function [Chryseobacterium taichungense]
MTGLFSEKSNNSMELKIHDTGTSKIAEIISDLIIISSSQDGLDLLGNVYYQDFDKVIVHEKNITPAFFDLKTKIAGEILQKFSNYRVRLAIVGDFSKYPGNSLQEFILESNKGRQVVLVDSIEEAVNKLSD